MDAWEEGEVHTGFGGQSWVERDHLEDLVIKGMIILKCVLKTLDWDAWTGLIWREPVSFPGRTLLRGVISDWLCLYSWWFVTDECFKFGSGFLCSYSRFVWSMSWTEFSAPIHDVARFKVLPFITQYWNIFPCAMFVCWGVGRNVALLEGQHCVRKKRYSYWSTRCNEQLLACHLLTDGQTGIMLLLLLEWPAFVTISGCVREPAILVRFPSWAVICRPLTIDTQVRSLNSPSKICDESCSTQYFSFPLSQSLD